MIFLNEDRTPLAAVLFDLVSLMDIHAFCQHTLRQKHRIYAVTADCSCAVHRMAELAVPDIFCRDQCKL